MRVFISYHRADEKYRDKIEKMLKNNCISYFVVPKSVNFNGKNHQYIKDIINEKMCDCDVILCIVGKETYSRPHVDWELHEALKGRINQRKGILVVMLERRLDNKNSINYATFPNRLQDNKDYIIIEQFCSLSYKINSALNEALSKSWDESIQVNNRRQPMQLRQGKYFDEN